MSDTHEVKPMTDNQRIQVGIKANIDFFLAELNYKKAEVEYCEQQLVKLYAQLKRVQNETV